MCSPAAAVASPPTPPAASGIDELEARRKREEATFNPPDYFRSFIQLNHRNTNQELYNRRSLQIVNAAAEAVKADLHAKKDPVAIFRNLLESLATERQKLAKELGTRDAEMFGQWMDRNGSDSFIATSLGAEQYQRYGNRILGAIQKRLKELIKSKQTAYHKEDKNFWKGWGDNTCRVYVKVIGAEMIESWAQIRQGESMSSKKAMQTIGKDLSEVLIETNDGVKITCEDLGKGILLANAWYPSVREAKGTPIAHNLKNTYILMTVVLKVEGVWRTMTSYLTWAYEDHPYQLTEEIIDRMGQDCVDPIDRFPRKQSQIVILHNCRQEKIEAVIQASGRIFSQVAAWDRKDMAELKRWRDEIAYNIVELNPWIRGTGAIVKYTDAVMRKIHGFELVPYHPEKFLDLEVHANPFKPNFLRDNPQNEVQNVQKEKKDQTDS